MIDVGLSIEIKAALNGEGIPPILLCCDVLWTGSEPCWVCGGPGRPTADLSPGNRPPAWTNRFTPRYTAGEEPL